jgi:hypothetical protein
MKKKFATALSEARKIATTAAATRPANSAKPAPATRIPRMRWIQPQAVVSMSNV